MLWGTWEKLCVRKEIDDMGFWNLKCFNKSPIAQEYVESCVPLLLWLCRFSKRVMLCRLAFLKASVSTYMPLSLSRICVGGGRSFIVGRYGILVSITRRRLSGTYGFLVLIIFVCMLDGSQISDGMMISDLKLPNRDRYILLCVE